MPYKKGENKSYILLILFIVLLLTTCFQAFLLINVLTQGKITGNQILTDSEEGIAKLEILGAVAITINGAIDFGSGVTNESASTKITTEGANPNGFNDCTITTGFPAVTGLCAGLEIINSGNSDVNVTVNTSRTADQFIGGTGPLLQFFGTNGTIASTSVNHGCGGVNLIRNATELNFTQNMLCQNLTYQTGADYITFELNLSIPSDAPPMTNTQAVLTFVAKELP